MIKIKGYFFSLILAFIISSVLICLTALLFTYTNINDIYLQSFVTGIVTISCLVPSIFLTRRIKEKGLFYGALFGILYFLMLYIISACTYSSFLFNNTVLVYFGVCALSGIVGGVIGVNFK